METLLLRAEEVAAQLQLSRSKVYQLMQKGQIPTVRFGKSVRVPSAALAEWVAGQTLGQDQQRGQVGWDVERLLNESGLVALGPTSTTAEAIPVLERLSAMLHHTSPLVREEARHRCIQILTKARVRAPTRLVELAFKMGNSRKSDPKPRVFLPIRKKG